MVNYNDDIFVYVCINKYIIVESYRRMLMTEIVVAN